jgi:hypothetical protein
MTAATRPTTMTTTTRTIAMLLALVLGGLGAGCSFIFMEGPPEDHAKSVYFDCTSTYGLSVADGFFALSGGAAAGAALSQSKQAYADKNSGASRNAAAGVDLTLAVGMAASALYGVVQATRCDRAKEALKARIFMQALHPPPPPSLLPPIGATSGPPPTFPAPGQLSPPVSVPGAAPPTTESAPPVPGSAPPVPGSAPPVPGSAPPTSAPPVSGSAPPTSPPVPSPDLPSH